MLLLHLRIHVNKSKRSPKPIVAHMLHTTQNGFEMHTFLSIFLNVY